MSLGNTEKLLTLKQACNWVSSFLGRTINEST